MKVMKAPASIQEPHSAHLGQFHLRFTVDCIWSKQIQQISMTSSGRSHAFTSSNLLHSLTTSFRGWHLLQFWVVQTELLELISTKKRLTKPFIAVVHVAENK